MNKKDLKFYEAPATTVVEVEYRGMLCSSPGSNPEDVKDEEEIDLNQ